MRGICRFLVCYIFSAATLLLSPNTFAAPDEVQCKGITDETLSMSALEKLIRNPNCNIRYLDDVLPLLSDKHKDDYALVYRSRSLQGPHVIDYENPRAILYSVKGPIENQKGLFVSFNGQSQQANYNNLEVLEIDSSSRDVFRYYDIQFPAKSNSRELDWSEAQKRLAVSNANPRKCQTCHGSPARPIWASYPEWPGVFGSFHIIGPSDEEKKGFESYLQTSKDHPRYSQLKPNPDLLSAEVNNSINVILNRLNMYRVVRDLQTTRQFDLFSPALALASFNECGKEYFKKAIPEFVRNELDTTIEDRFHLTEKIGPSQKKLALQSFQDPDQNFFWSSEVSDFQPSHDDYFLDQPMLGLIWLDTLVRQGPHRKDFASAKVRYLIEGRGISMLGWFLDLKEGKYRWADGSSWGGGFGRTLLDQDVSLRNLGIPKSQYGYYEIDSSVCEKLANESALRLGNLKSVMVHQQDKKADYSLPENYPVTFVNTCANCHSSEADIAPHIPFDQPTHMSQWIKNKHNQIKLKTKLTTDDVLERMPPTRDLTPQELNGILDYIK